MKAIQSVRVSFFLWAFALVVFFFCANTSFAADIPAAASSSMLLEIKEKLIASENRKKQIIANQEKILAEIEISRKWQIKGPRKKKP